MDAVTGPDRIEQRLEQMVSLYQLPLLRLCYAYLHDEELARDAVQDTFLKAYRNLETFREEASEKSWLIRIAINTCKDLRKSGWFRHVDRTVTPEMLPETSAPAEPFDVNLSIEIMRLPIRLREAALLCWLQGLTQEEAAQALGISHQAVASRLNRARKNCAPRWKGVRIMTLREEQEKVQKAMNAALSGLREDPFLAGRVLANAKGEKPMKKKLSFSIVTAVVLIVLSISVALAAGLRLFGELSGTYAGDPRLTALEQIAVPVGLEWTTEDGITVQIEQAYYEGSRVFISYRVSGNWNATVLHEGTPDIVNFDDVEENFIAAENMMSDIPERNAALQQMDGSQPIWLECRDANLHDGLFLADGTYLDIIGGDGIVQEDGSWIGWKECEIPEERIADTLEFKAVLYRVSSVLYQKGTTYATSYEQGESTDLPFTLTRNKNFIGLSGTSSGENWQAEASLLMGQIDLRGSIFVTCPESWIAYWNSWDDVSAEDGMITDWHLYRGSELINDCGVEAIWCNEENQLVFEVVFPRMGSRQGLTLVPVYADETKDPDHAIPLT